MFDKLFEQAPDKLETVKKVIYSLAVEFAVAVELMFVQCIFFSFSDALPVLYSSATRDGHCCQGH